MFSVDFFKRIFYVDPKKFRRAILLLKKIFPSFLFECSIHFRGCYFEIYLAKTTEKRVFLIVMREGSTQTGLRLILLLGFVQMVGFFKDIFWSNRILDKLYRCVRA